MKSLLIVAIIAIVYVFAAEAWWWGGNDSKDVYYIVQSGNKPHNNNNNNNCNNCNNNGGDRCDNICKSTEHEKVCTRYKNANTTCRAFINDCQLKKYVCRNGNILQKFKDENKGNCTAPAGQNSTCKAS